MARSRSVTKVTSSHPTYAVMIKEAVAKTAGRTGTSRQATKKWITDHYPVNSDRFTISFKLAFKKLQEAGSLSAKDGSQKFSLTPAAKASVKKPAAKKRAKSVPAKKAAAKPRSKSAPAEKKKAAKKKTTTKKEKVAPKKKTVSKKKTDTKKTVKKPAAKKSATKKAAAPKKRKASPSKKPAAKKAKA